MPGPELCLFVLGVVVWLAGVAAARPTVEHRVGAWNHKSFHSFICHIAVDNEYVRMLPAAGCDVLQRTLMRVLSYVHVPAS
jgi:hypothetical protein